MEAQSKLSEQCVMQRLQYSEAMQQIADLKQAMAQMDLKKAERWTHSQLRGSSVCDMDEESIGSRHSLVAADAVSIASEDMQALIADMTVRLPDELEPLAVTDEGVICMADDGSATETEATGNCRLKTVVTRKEDGNETGDSGLQLSDSSR